MSVTKRSFWTVLFIAFVDNLSVGILLPLLPLLLTTQSSNVSILPSHLTDAQGYIIFGYLLASYTIAQFITTPILGQLSDKYGRRRILLLSLLGTTFSYLLFGYAVITAHIPLLFIARIIDGATGGNLSVAQAVVADITEQKDRAKAYGLFGAALGVGFALGPAIGAFFSNAELVSWFSPTTPFWVAACLAFLSVLMVAFFLPETYVPATQESEKPKLSLLALIGKAFSYPNFRSLFAGIFIWRLGFAFWTTFATVFLIYRFGFDQNDMGLYFFYTGAWLIFSQIVLVRLLAKKIASEKVLYWTIFFSAAAFLVYLVPTNWYYLLLLIPFIASSNALTLANLPAVVSHAAGPENQGEFSGRSNSVQALALSIAPILSGYISASLSPVMVITVSSMLLAVAGGIFVVYQRRYRP